MTSFNQIFEIGNGAVRVALTAVLVGVLFWVLGIILGRTILPALSHLFERKNHHALALLFKGFRRPVSTFFKVFAFSLLVIILSKQLPLTFLAENAALSNFWVGLTPFFTKVIRIAFIVCIAWGLMASHEVTPILLRNFSQRADSHLTQGMVRFLTAIFNVLVVAIAVVVILQEFGYNISGLITGLGLGSLTIALAAKDSAANFFGGLILITEKPFEIGDWISTKDAAGTVEDISLRSTKLRDKTGFLTVVPNANLAASAITNGGSVVEKRRAEYFLQFSYASTRQQLQNFIQRFKIILLEDKEVLNENITLAFSDFGESSLDIKVIFYTSVTSSSAHLAVRERINYHCMDLAEELGLEFAFPSRTVYLQNNEPSTTNQA